MWQLLMAMTHRGLKNDALMDTFYDVVMEHYRADRAYAILVFHDRCVLSQKVLTRNASGNQRKYLNI